jgi:phage protein D/phage baseplate assembly protein gpV
MPDVIAAEPSVTLSGNPLPASVTLERVIVDESVLLPATCALTIRDPDRDVIQTTGFDLGSALTVDAVTGNETKQIFDGEITSLEAELDATGSHVIVRAYGKSHRLHRGRKTRTWTETTDSDAVQSVLSEAGLTATVDSTSVVHPFLAQTAQTDWEFVGERARAVGFQFGLVDGQLKFAKPEAPSGGVSLKVDENLVTFRPRVSGVGQAGTIEARGWDVATNDAVVASATVKSTATASVSLAPTQATQAFGEKTFAAATLPLAQQDAAQAVADALAERIASTFVEAEGSTFGDPGLRAGSAIAIAGAGYPFDGDYSLTEVRHVFDAWDGYLTHFTISGRQERSLLGLASVGATNGAGAPPASGLHGPFVGVVTDTKDPDNVGRVKVKVPWLADDAVTDWARVVYPGAGTERGLVLVPEVDDEVLLLFAGGDLERAYVIGSLYNANGLPPDGSTLVSQSDGTTALRLLKTRKQHLLKLDDAEAGGGITIQTGDSQQGKIVLDAAAHTITIESGGDITIEAKNAGKLTLKAGSSMSIEATSSLELKAPTITIDGSGKVDVKSSGQLNLEGTSAKLTGQANVDVIATGIAQLQGALVKIN